MSRCYLCREIGEKDLDPCPNDPPCEPYNVCNFQVTHCHHKDRVVEVPVVLRAGDLPVTMLLTGLPKEGAVVRYTDISRTWGKRREWQTAMCTGVALDPWGDPFYLLEALNSVVG